MKTPWPGFNEMGSLIIPLAWSDLPLPETPVYIDGDRFEPKDELHVTVIGKQAGQEMQTRLPGTRQTEAALREDFEKIDWNFTPGTRLHVLSRARQKPRESTIVPPLEMPGMLMFYECLKSRGLTKDDAPLPHITVYQRSCPGGIGVPDGETLIDLTVRCVPSSALVLESQNR